MDDTASVITDVTDAQVESMDVNLDLVESWNELELREAQVCIIMLCVTSTLCCVVLSSNRSPDF